jgi:hypothetical protein
MLTGIGQPLRAWYVRKEYAIMRIVVSRLSTQEDMAMVMSKTTSKGQTTTPERDLHRFGLKAGAWVAFI